MRPPTPTTYNAFISYSHKVNGALGPALRDALHDFARPWYQLRAVRVFCDKSSISLTAGLWGSIEAALSASTTFILLASPDSAQSHWVQKEVDYWKTLQPRRPMILVLTDGEIAWSDARNDFDWSTTNAVPASLCGWFTHEPLWLDLREVTYRATRSGQPALSTSDPGFLDVVATIAATLQGKPKDQLIGEDVQKYRSARRFRRYSWSTLSCLTVLALVAAFIAVVQRNEARHQARVATGERLVAQADASRANDPRDSLELALAANATDPTPAAQAALKKTLVQTHYAATLRGHDGGVAKVLFTSDGRTLISCGADGKVIIWDMATRSSIASLPMVNYQLTAMALNSDGSLLAVNGGPVTSIWDITDLHNPKRLSTITTGGTDQPAAFDVISTVAFQPDGHMLAVSNAFESSLSLWDLGNPAQPRQVYSELQGLVTSIKFTPDGETLITAGSDLSNQTGGYVVDLWSVDGEELYPLRSITGTGKSEQVSAIDVSPDGRMLAVASGSLINNTEVDLWSMSGSDAAGLLGSFTLAGSVQEMAISPDGQVVAAAGSDDTATIWDIGTPSAPRQAAVLGGHKDELYGVSFSGNGQLIATASNDKTIILWRRYSVDHPSPVGGFASGLSSVNAAALSRDGTILAIGGGDNTMVLWRITDSSHPTLLAHVSVPLLSSTVSSSATVIRGGLSGIEDLAFSPDGRFLAVGGNGDPDGGGAVNLYDVSDPARPIHLRILGDQRHAIDRVAISPDGTVMATSELTPEPGGTTSLLLWNIADPRQPGLVSRSPTSLRSINHLTFDGDVLFASGYMSSSVSHGATIAWSTTDPRKPVVVAKLGDDRDAATAIGIGGNHAIGTGGTAGDVVLWRLDSSPQRVTSLAADRAGIESISINDTGTVVAAAGRSGMLSFWDVSRLSEPVILSSVPMAGEMPVQVLFRSSQAQLVSVQADGTVLLWSTAILLSVMTDPMAMACDMLAPGPSPTEWIGKLDPEVGHHLCP